MIVEENRTLNDCEVERALSYVRAGKPPSLNDLPKDILEPVSLDDVWSQLSTAPSVLVECGTGIRPPVSLARERRLRWLKPVLPENLRLISHPTPLTFTQLAPPYPLGFFTELPYH